MTLEAQRIAIAEHCGFAWYRIPHSEKHSRGPLRSLFLPAVHELDQDPIWMVRADGTERIANWQYMRDEGHVPNYTEDLNDMRDAAITLNPHQRQEFAKRLRPKYKICPLLDYFEVANATAEQRAEAFLKAVGKWKD